MSKGILESEKEIVRVGWDEYFINLLESLSSRSTCRRRQTAAIIVKNNRIVATGYNGQPPGMKHCNEIGFCLREKLKIPSGQRAEICRAVHAEENAILQAAHLGIKLEDSIMYVKASPCSYCTKSILSVGIKKVVYIEIYPDDLAIQLREETPWVKWEKYKPPVYLQDIIELYADEELKPLKRYPLYWISNYGRVFKNAVLDEKDDLLDIGIWIEPNYAAPKREVTLKDQYNNKFVEDVATLVAETWLENPHNYKFVGMVNKNKDSCHKDNLEWVEKE